MTPPPLLRELRDRVLRVIHDNVRIGEERRVLDFPWKRAAVRTTWDGNLRRWGMK
jgi:hypothetical protein